MGDLPPFDTRVQSLHSEIMGQIQYEFLPILDEDAESIMPGSIVRLVHGGPEMTVESQGTVTSAGVTVRTLWFDSNNHLQRESFNAKTLLRRTPL